jgi:uncharacterized protein
VGISKTGVSGLGMLSVVIFAQILPAKQATGMVLPMLCFADIVAVLIYRQHAQWKHLWRLFPWTAAGVLAGYFALGRIDDNQARVLIGSIVVTLVTLTLINRWRSASTKAAADAAAIVSAPWWFPPAIGMLAGFTTLVANAAGTLMAIYLLAMRLPKLHFVGTGAVFLLLLNLFKVPFMVHLELINAASFSANILLLPGVLIGTWVGRKLLMVLNQRLFENLALAVGALAGLKLLW